MFWKKKKDEPARAQQKPSDGFFSTDLDFWVEGKDAFFEWAFGRTFQRGAENFKAIDAAGNEIAMDATPMQEAKARYASDFMLGIPEAQLGWYANQGFIGYQICAMIAQNWLVDKACTMPARDACRNGFDTIVENGTEVSPDTLDALKKMDERMRLMDNMVEAVRFSRIFGIRIVLFDVLSTDPEYYQKPFNPDGVTPNSYRGMIQVDPYWVTPELDLQAASNPATKNFYEPTWWRINGVRYHRSHLIVIRTNEVADILKPTYFYGGVPLPQKIYERVYAAERTANEAPLLAMTKRSTFIHTDIAQALANQAQFDERMEAWTRYRDNMGVKILGKEETAEQFDTSLTDLDAVIMTQFQLVAAIAEVPATKLLGTTPKGFNATGEFEEASYHEMLESIQSHDLTPLVNRHHLLCIRSEISPKNPFVCNVAWKPVDSPTAKEQAEINEIKARAGNTLVGSGAISPDEERMRLINDPDSGYAALENMDEDDDGEEELETPSMDSLDIPVFDPAKGEYRGATLVTNQQFLNCDIVEQKRAILDYSVQVSPEFLVNGKKYRIIIDGHHSLAAAIQDGQLPIFVEGEYKGSDYKNAITQGRAFDSKEASRQMVAEKILNAKPKQEEPSLKKEDVLDMIEQHAPKPVEQKPHIINITTPQAQIPPAPVIPQPIVNVKIPDITVNTPDVRIENNIPAQAQADINISMPDVKVNVETPAVNVNANIQPSDVNVSLPRRVTETTVEYDSNGNIKSTTQTEKDA